MSGGGGGKCPGGKSPDTDVLNEHFLFGKRSVFIQRIRQSGSQVLPEAHVFIFVLGLMII